MGLPGSGHGELNGPYGLAADAAGNVYVAELYNHRIQKFTSDGAFITQWGTFGDGNGQFQYPGEMAVDAAGNVYVPEYNQHWVQQFTDDGIFVSKWGSFGNAPGQFEYPAGVATDAAGDIYVADSNNNRVEKFHPAPPRSRSASTSIPTPSTSPREVYGSPPSSSPQLPTRRATSRWARFD